MKLLIKLLNKILILIDERRYGNKILGKVDRRFSEVKKKKKWIIS